MRNSYEKLNENSMPYQGSKQRKFVREGFWGVFRAIWRVFLEILPLQKSREKPRKTQESMFVSRFVLSRKHYFFCNILHFQGVKTKEIRKGRILAGVRDIWRVVLEILPLQNSKKN